MPRKRSSKPIISTSALARHLGLSRWTISRVLNGHPEVKPETSRRVREAMDELGFVPSPLGRALRGASTGMIGVCFQAIGLPIISRKIATLQRVLREAGFRALQEVTDGSLELELTVIRHFLAMRVDGLVLVGGMSSGNASKITTLLDQHKTPVVMIDPQERLPLPAVELDRRAGMRCLFEHLYELGHRRFALLGIDGNVPWGRIRCDAIEAIVREHGLSSEHDVVRLSDPAPLELNFAYGKSLAEQFLQLIPRPTAILAINDQVAIGAMLRLQEAGVAVADEVSIVGFDNLDVSPHIKPALTSVDQHIDEIMQTAVALLVRQTGGNSSAEPAFCQVNPLLIPRESSAAAPVSAALA
ncbi:MAG: LacI family DNA-binding transcriptional regulator [Opitutaceae bacterium]